MEPVAKRPRSEFEDPGLHGDPDSRRFKPTDGKDVGQPVSSGGKPKPCMKYFSTSGCPFGESCHFLHHVPGGLGSLGLVAPVVSLSASSASSLQKKAADPGTVTVNGYKTKLCNRFSTAEGCRFGDRCHFAHGETDLRSSSNMPRGNNRRPIVNGPIGAVPPGFSNPAGNGPSFAPQGYAQPTPQGYMQPPHPQGYRQPNQSGVAGNNPQFPNSTGNPAPAWDGPQSYPQPHQHGVPANAGSGAYSSGPVDNVPVY